MLFVQYFSTNTASSAEWCCEEGCDGGADLQASCSWQDAEGD